MLRLRNSNRRFSHKSNRTSGRYFSRRNHRASNGEIYVVDGLEKMVQEDNWSQGVLDTGSIFDIDEGFKGKTIREVIEKVADFIGISPKDVENNLVIYEDGMCQLSVEENADGEIPSPREEEQFRKEEINLYLADYSFYIQRVSPDITAEEIVKVYPKADTIF